MSISRLLSDLFTGSEPSAESATTPDGVESEGSSTVIHECRNCGTNVSADTSCCPACDGDDIVHYFID